MKSNGAKNVDIDLVARVVALETRDETKQAQIENLRKTKHDILKAMHNSENGLLLIKREVESNATALQNFVKSQEEHNTKMYNQIVNLNKYLWIGIGGGFVLMQVAYILSEKLLSV